jgi:hypothetical protein
VTTFGQRKGSLLLCYFSSWLVEGAHGLDLPGIASAPWLPRSHAHRQVYSKSTEEMLDVAGTYFPRGGGERPLGLGDMRFQTAHFVIRGHLINTRCSCHYDSLLPKILDSLQLCSAKSIEEHFLSPILLKQRHRTSNFTACPSKPIHACSLQQHQPRCLSTM